MLNNIVVGLSDLTAVKSDIVSRYLTDDINYQDLVSAVKKDVYGELKLKLKASYPSYGNVELDSLMEDIKDLPNEENLTRRVATLVVAKIYEDNDLMQQAAYYRQIAAAIPFTYYLDIDESGTVGSDEQVIHSNVVLGR